MLTGFSPHSFEVLFCSVLLCCRQTPETTGPCCQWCPFSIWGCVWVWHCSSSSVEELCMMYKIRCNPMHPLYGALLVPYVPVRITRVTVAAYRFTYALPRCRTSQHPSTFIPLSVSLWNDFTDPVFDMVWDWWVSIAGPMLFNRPKLLYPFLSSTIILFLYFLSIGRGCEDVVFGLIVCIQWWILCMLSKPCNADLF